MSCTNMHKAKLRSQISIFDTGSFTWARPLPNDSPYKVLGCAGHGCTMGEQGVVV